MVGLLQVTTHSVGLTVYSPDSLTLPERLGTLSKIIHLG